MHDAIKDPFEVQSQSVDFDVTEDKEFIDMVSAFTLQLIFKKLTFAKFSLSYRHKIILEGLSCPHLNDEGAVTQEL